MNGKCKPPVTCKYVIARRRSPCEIELKVERACHNYKGVILSKCKKNVFFLFKNSLLKAHVLDVGNNTGWIIEGNNPFTLQSH